MFLIFPSMEAAAGVAAAAARGVPLSIPSSQPSRKEWRVVSETSVRNSGNEVLLFTSKPTCIPLVSLILVVMAFYD